MNELTGYDDPLRADRKNEYTHKSTIKCGYYDNMHLICGVILPL